MARLEPAQPIDLFWVWIHAVLLIIMLAWFAGAWILADGSMGVETWLYATVVRLPPVLVGLQGIVFFIGSNRTPVRQRLLLPEAASSDSRLAAWALWFGVVLYQLLLVAPNVD